MRRLTLDELVVLHDRLIRAWGRAPGHRDLGALELAAAQPGMTFAGEDLYPDLPAKPPLAALACLFAERR